MEIFRRLVISKNSMRHVSVLRQHVFDDGSYELRAIDGGDLDFASAIDLSAELLRAAGEVLKYQAASMKQAASRERKRQQKQKK